MRRDLTAHGVAMASTCIVLACVPALFNWATWLLSDIFGEGGGVHVYAVNAAFGFAARQKGPRSAREKGPPGRISVWCC